MDHRKRQAILDFQQRTKQLLSERERKSLYGILRVYQRGRRVDRFVNGLLEVLKSREKLELIPYIRRIMPSVHQEIFDRLLRHSTSKNRHHLQVDQRSQRSIRSLYSERTFDDVSVTSEVEVIMIHRDPKSPTLGFSVRGGSEHGLGVYVSDVDRGSVADVCGLELGDKILEVNNISFKNLASSSAVKVLTGSNQLKLVVEKTGQIPEWRLSKEKTAWYECHKQKLVRGDFEECGTMNFIRGLDVDVPERRVTLDNRGELGFNIRGGNEYGLGIYVSSVDKGGQAEEKGVRVGDQIVDVNGIPFENIPHANAVDVLKSESHLIVTLRDVGRYPAYKELYAEYSWSKRKSHSDRGSTQGKLKETRLPDIWIESEHKPKNPALHRKVPVEVLSQKSYGSRTSRSDVYDSLHQSDGLPMQSEIYLPKGQGVCTEEDSDLDDDLDSVAMDLWRQREGFQNPSYVPDSSRQGSEVTKSETDDESGIHGAYTVSTENEHSDKQEKISTLPKTSYYQGSSIHESVHDVNVTDGQMTDLEEDDAVYIMSSMRAAEHHDVSDQVSEGGRSVTESRSSRGKSQSCRKSPSPSPPPKPKRTNLPISSMTSKTTKTETVHFREMIHDLDDSSVRSEESDCRYCVEESDVSDLSQVSSMNTTQTLGEKSKEETTKREERALKTTSFHEFIRYIPPPPSEHPHELETEQRVQSSPDHAIPQVSTDTENHILARKQSEGFEVTTSDHEDEEESVMRNFDDQIRFIEGENVQLKTNLHEDTTKETKDNIVLGTGERRETLTEASSNTHVDNGRKDSTEIAERSGKWKAIKEKLKGSLRFKSSIRARLKRSKPVVAPSDGSKAYVPGCPQPKTTMTSNSMKLVEESGRKLMSEAELKEVVKQIRLYHESHDVDTLVDVLLNVLDEPEKILLLRDIRSVVYPVDMYRFEQRVDIYEIEAYEKLSTKLHLHLNHEKDRKPRRHLLHTEIDEHGHFYIKPVEQFEKEQKTKQKVVEILKQHSTDREMAPPAIELPTRQDSFRSSETSSTLSHDSSMCDTITAYVSKNKPSLGLCVSGGTESKKQPQIKVEQIIPGGAAADEYQIKPGMVILSIDGQSMVGASHETAVRALTTSFDNKRKVNMKIVLQKEASTEL